MGADLFSIGRSSLGAAKKSLSTTSHNIANSNTEGYSRQRITTKTNTPAAEGPYVLGTGVDVKGVKRVHDKLVEKKLNSSLTNNQFNEERTFQLERVEEIFNELNSDGLNKILNRFFNSFRELSNQPENEIVRNLVRDNSTIVVSDFNRIHESITISKESINKKIGGAVADINQQAETIANLNIEITRLENMGGETGDLRDQRDNAVRQISEFFKTNTYEDEKNQYVVNVVGVGSLVAGGITNRLKAGTISSDGTSKSEGQTEVYFEAKPSHILSRKLKTGKLGALIKTRNEDLVELRDRLDMLSHGLVHSTNAIHRRGYINKTLPTDAQGRVIDDGSQGKVRGINFFKEPLSLKNAGEFISLSDEVKADLNNIATGLAPNSPGDNRIAIAISKLQHEKILDGGNATFEEGYLTAVSKIGLSTAKSRIDGEQSGGILAQAKSIKERVSGVSIDEETANMVKYQHAYDASARVIKVADEMFDSVIAMMR